MPDASGFPLISRSAAGEFSPPSRALSGPATPRRSVCAGNAGIFIVLQTASNKGESPCRSTSAFRTWIPTAAQAAGDSAGPALAIVILTLGREGGPRRRPRSAALVLEQLETRITLSATTLASFIAPAGLAPQAAVIMDSSGNLYGTTGFGGATGDGTVFELAARQRRAHRARLLQRHQRGKTVWLALIMDSSGNLYGTTLIGRRLRVTARCSSWPRAAARSPRWPRSTAPTGQDRMPR